MPKPLQLDRDNSTRTATLLGHPTGLGWLAATEFWERFSYYGMQALLVLYMTHRLLEPGHIEHVLGFTSLRHLLEAINGRALSGQALASATYGLYAGLVYLTPMAGGFIADRFTGRTIAITVGASLMALGHFLMAFDASFVLALICLLVGVGFFKGNILVQVGDLYGPDDPRRSDAFQIYTIAIQIAVIVSPLVCGTLGETVGWHLGFGAAGVGMVIGLAIYLFGRTHLPAERKKTNVAAQPSLTHHDKRLVLALVALVPVFALATVGNLEIYNAYLVWAEKNFQLVFFGRTMPITWMLAVDAVVSTLLIAGSVWFWRWYGKHRQEPHDITKISIGVAIGACAPALLAAASVVTASTGHPVSLSWAVAFHVINDLGFANFYPIGMAFYSRTAPKRVEGLIIAVYLLHLFLGNMLVGHLGGLLELMPATQFWLLHVALMAIPSAILFSVRRFF